MRGFGRNWRKKYGSLLYSWPIRANIAGQKKTMPALRLLNDTELAAAKFNLKGAKASLACEGMYLTPEENALFARFEAERLPHEERRRQILEFCLGKQHAVAAE